MPKRVKKMAVALDARASTKGIVARAALVFLEHGAKAAYKFLGSSLRAKELLPKAFAKAKYIEREAKRRAE